MLCAPTPEPSAEFSDVPLNLPAELPASPQTPLTQLSGDQNEKAEPDQCKDMFNQTEAGERPSSTADVEPRRLPKVDQRSPSSQLGQCDQNVHGVNVEPLNVCCLYPPLPSLTVEAQLLVDPSSISSGLVEASLMSAVSRESGQLCPSPAVLPLADQESSPPSLVPVEMAEAERPREKLYPELPRPCQVVQPFTCEQLRMWEPGSWLKNVELHASEFKALAHQEGHELHELLLNYWRCRKQLTQAQAEQQAASSDCKSTQNRLWSFRDEQLTLQVRSRTESDTGNILKC